MRLVVASYKAVAVRSAPRICTFLGNFFFSTSSLPPVSNIVASVETAIVVVADSAAVFPVSLLLTGLATSRDPESQQAPNRNERHRRQHITLPFFTEFFSESSRRKSFLRS